MATPILKTKIHPAAHTGHPPPSKGSRLSLVGDGTAASQSPQTQSGGALPTLAMINVVMQGDSQFDQEIPMGVGAIAAYLREQNFPVTIHQCQPDGKPEELEAAIEVEADLYGFQLNMVNYLSVRAVAEGIKARRPQALIVLGGPFLAAQSESILASEPLFDCIVVGEGEETVRLLMQALHQQKNPSADSASTAIPIVPERSPQAIDFAAIAGLVWRKPDGTIVHNPPRPLIPDLDILPFPARDFLGQAQRDPKDGGLMESVRISTSRGCIARCSFCSVNFYTRLQKGKLWRGRSATKVVDELEHLSKNHHARIFNFADSSFEDPGKKGKERTRKICTDIIQRQIPLSAKIYMRCDTLLEEEDEALLKLWKQAGIDIIIVGAESGSDQELAFFEKRANLEQNLRTVKRLQGIDGFFVMIGFIMFGPNSTLETIRQNIDFVRSLGLTDNPNNLSNVLMLIRDSKMYHVLREEGRVREPEHYWQLPKYTFKDPTAERVARHWDGLFGRFPMTLKLNSYQIQLENLIARMTNPMNSDILHALKDDFAQLKEQYATLKEELGSANDGYFREIVDRISADCSDEELHRRAQHFFVGAYGDFLPRYHVLHDEFIEKAEATGFGLSGLLFKHFYSNMVNSGAKRT
ncbi:MAG: cobalamin-dependent protein [Magnetococcales bacterium]|nr:cobalamin-dependent protein [Magnetococcales bacterium]